MNFRAILLASTIALAGCASVTSIPLNANGTRATGQEEGIRYYKPKPYLLITELPETTAKPTTNTDGGSGKKKAAGTSGGNKSGSGDDSSDSDTKDSTATTNTPSTGTADTSFSASMASYSVKLIYLPDYSHPMALQTSTGLFGTVSIGPTLQDGWMLTGMSQSVDSGTSGALSSIASLVTAGMGSKGGGGGGGGGDNGSGATTHAAPMTAQTQQALEQRVAKALDTVPADKLAADDKQKLETDLHTALGDNTKQLDVLGRVKAALDNAPVAQLTVTNRNKLLTDLQKALAPAATTPQTGGQQNPLANWGAGVLQPGLYEFRYDEDSGVFQGFYPIALFCGDGVVWKDAKGKTTKDSGISTEPAKEPLTCKSAR
ncbi:MAG TPA: hypothetical protein VGG48_10370 [Rhizomicrobium sp.]|jgi:hypothetical protein